MKVDFLPPGRYVYHTKIRVIIDQALSMSVLLVVILPSSPNGVSFLVNIQQGSLPA